jgi:hypothetical protein
LHDFDDKINHDDGQMVPTIIWHKSGWFDLSKKFIITPWLDKHLNNFVQLILFC